MLNSLLDVDGVFEEPEDDSSSPSELLMAIYARRKSLAITEMTSPLKSSLDDILAVLRALALLPDNSLDNVSAIFDAFLLLLIQLPESLSLIVGTCLQLQEVLQLPKKESKSSVKQKLRVHIHRRIAFLMKLAAAFSGNEDFRNYVDEVSSGRKIGAPELIRLEEGGDGAEGGGRGDDGNGEEEDSASFLSIQIRRTSKKKFDGVFMFSKSKIEAVLGSNLNGCSESLKWSVGFDGKEGEGWKEGRGERGGEKEEETDGPSIFAESIELNDPDKGYGGDEGSSSEGKTALPSYF